MPRFGNLQNFQESHPAFSLFTDILQPWIC